MRSTAIPPALRLASPTAASATLATDDVGPAIAVPIRDRLLVDIHHAAELLSVGRTTITELIADGSIRPVRIGRRVLFHPRELERFADELLTSGTSPAASPQPEE